MVCCRLISGAFFLCAGDLVTSSAMLLLFSANCISSTLSVTEHFCTRPGVYSKGYQVAPAAALLCRMRLWTGRHSDRLCCVRFRPQRRTHRRVRQTCSTGRETCPPRFAWGLLGLGQGKCLCEDLSGHAGLETAAAAAPAAVPGGLVPVKVSTTGLVAGPVVLHTTSRV